MRLTTPRTLILAFAGVLGLCCAQTGSGTLTGTVTDATGAAIPEAVVSIVNTDNGSRLETVTNSSGIYRIPSLAPGGYRLDISKVGFDSLAHQGITLTVGAVIALDLTLKVGQSTTTLTVEDSAPLTESQTSSTGQLVNRKMVSGLPMPNRAATSLAALAPGVVMIDTGSGAENYPVFSVAGGRARNQNFTLDGGNVTNAVGLTRPQQMTSLPMDAMQEFRVLSNTYAAENGHSTGGVIELSTRSGTNQLHGSAFEFLRNSVLDARNFFAVRKPPLRMNQYGASLGGPIRKDKTHFFATWEETRQLSSTIALQTVPTAAQAAGDFSRLPNLIYDPATTVGRDRQPFAGNIIPASRFDPVGRNVFAYWPQANRAGAANFGANNNSTLRRDIGVFKLDHRLRPNDQLTLRYYVNDSFIENLGSFGVPVSDANANTNDARIQSILGSHTHTFSPNLINELRVSFLQRKFIDQRYGAGENLAASLGLPGVSAAAFPTFNVPGYASLGNQVSRTHTPIRDLQFLESVSSFRGRHALKAGVEFRKGSNNELRDRSSSGSFTISPLITSKPGVSGTGNSLASLLLGEVNSASILVSDQILSRAYYWAGYVQDDWRVTDRLTLNVGLRWESELPRRVDNDFQNSFDLTKINPVSGTPGVVTFSGRNGVPRPAFNTDLNNFGPRAGFAYRAPWLGETIIRGGGGIFYGPTVSNTIGDTASTGFSTSNSLVVPQADLLSAIQLRNGFPVIPRPALNDAFGAVPLGTRPNTSVGFFERERPTPLSYQYNLSVQHELRRNTVIEGGYMANISHHLTANDLSLNQVAPGLMGPGDAQARRPFPQFSDVYIINPAVGNSTYHAGFIRAERRFSRNFAFLAHYTFSKFIDDAASSNEYGDSSSYMDAYNRRLDKGLSGSDVPHRLIVSALVNVKGGVKIGVFNTMQSGAPFTVTTAANNSNSFTAGALRPDLVGDPHSGTQSLQRWFNTSAFAMPQAYHFGNTPRNSLRAGSLQTVDLSASKEFTITERVRADVRGEFFNLLNHANFDLPGRTLGNADFGAVLSARPARTVQLGLRLSF
ncbi:MAG TPA: carboxypeptidase regulatory-like domain-containing protein [Paludibaculum sp.]|jgi:hypothetical protein